MYSAIYLLHYIHYPNTILYQMTFFLIIFAFIVVKVADNLGMLPYVYPILDYWFF